MGNTLSKKLKRRIQDLCGLQSLSREDRLLKANEILNSNDLKQAICHQILGCTFKDIERAMTAVIKERHISEEQAEQLELESTMPEKYDLELDFKVNKHASNNVQDVRYRAPTRDEVARLIAASNAKYEPPTGPSYESDYPPMSRERCEQLVREHYEYKEAQNKKLKEDTIDWDSQKTTVSEPKIATKTKRSNSTKA
jgi:hypothetical protein